MTKVSIENIIIQNPKDFFVNDIKVQIIFNVLEDIDEGKLIRIAIYDCLCRLC